MVGRIRRSKIEVARHTKSGNLCSHMPRPIRRCSRDNKKQLVMQMEDLPKWLPSGWSVVIKTRKSGFKAGKKYKCYISSTGCKFYSKEEVFRYLKNGKVHSHTSEPNKRGAAMDSTKSANEFCFPQFAKGVMEGLPPGWIKEIKVTQGADRTRKRPYYIDLVTGYEFRSKKDVFRYLESGDLGQCATRPKKRQISEIESIDGQISPPTAAKKHKIVGNATRRLLFTRQSSRLSKAVENEVVLEPSVVEECLPLSMVAQDGETSQMISEAHQISEGMQNVEGKTVCAENEFISAPGAEVSQEKQPLEKLHSADGESSELISSAQESGGLENMEEKIICAKKDLISSEADVFAEKQPKKKPLDADGESYELIGEAIEFENMEEKMICCEKGLISVPAAVVSPEKQPPVKPQNADEESPEVITAAQESGCLENTVEKMACAEKGLISAPASEISRVKQLSEKLDYEDRESSELISAAQDAGGLENTGGKMFCAEKGLISAPAVEISAEKESLKKSPTADRTSSEPVSIAQQESESLEDEEHKIVHPENGLISAPSAKVSPEKQPSDKSLGKRKNRAQLRMVSGQDGKEFFLPRRASKRLAGLQAELAPDLGMSERSLRMVARQVNPATGVHLSSNYQASEEVDPEAAAEVVITLNTSRDLGVQFDENASKEGEKPMGDQAVPGELAGELVSDIQSSQKPESPLVLPFGDSWPDPCLEFAFKTLTGAIPVDDNLVIADYFQQNLSMDQDQSTSGFTFPDLGLHGFSQTDFLFQFGATEKPAAKQQSPAKPSFTSLGNCGMAACGDGSLQQRNGEGSKECQRKVNN